MLRNYLKIAVRNVRKHKFYASLNIFGLAIGLASCLLILLYVTDELRYDRFHEHADSIYRMNWDYYWNENEGVGSGTPPPLAATLVQEIPEVTATTRIYSASNMVVRHGDRFFNETRILGVDASFFDFFSFPLVEGNLETALSQPGSVILTKTSARKYFGDEPALGQTLQIGEDGEFLGRPYSSTFRVTGIVADVPSQSHIEFDMLTSMASHPQVAFFDWSWVWMQVVTYAMVEDGASIPAMEAKIEDLVATHAPQAFERVGFSYEDLIANGGRWNFVFQPMTDIYLGSKNIGSNRLGPIGNRAYLYIFSVVAIFILLIACINFMNLATARSVSRAKEIGVRKVLGSARRNLIFQFMTEAMLFSLVAMGLAVALAAVLLAPFNDLAGKELVLNLMQPIWLPGALLVLALVVGVLAGSYPSLYLSGFKPIAVLKGRLQTSGGSRGLRNGLVVLQFAVSIMLIVCTLVVQDQMAFFQETDLGFEKEDVLVISNENHRLGEQAATYTDLLKSHPQVINASVSTGVPPEFGFQDYYYVEGYGTEQFDLISYMVDDDFAATLGLEVVQGRGFSEDFSTNAEGVILNESAVQRFGWDDPIGKTITYPSSGTFTVIGVVRDFNFLTLHQPIVPFALFHTASKSYEIPQSSVVVRVRRDDLPATLATLENEWKALVPGTPFEYVFLDDRLAAEYQAEQRLGFIFLIFAGLAILIACLGLLGLAAFTAERRTKEIGIRKTLGATVSSVVVLLTKDFTKWVILANVLAWPLAWLAMDRWLQTFAYRVDISWQIFLMAGLAALFIAVLTVSYQAFKAAVANPVKALRANE